MCASASTTVWVEFFFGFTIADKFTVENMAPSSSLLLDGVVDVGIVRSLTLTMKSSLLLELVVGLCGGVTAST